MAKSKNRTWIKQHVKDPYVVQSQRDGYRSRASYKLLEIVEKERLIRPGMVVVDLGSAPGGWSQVAAELVGDKGTVVGVDILPIRLKHGPRFDVLGFRSGKFAYCTDVNEISEEAFNCLMGLDVLVLGALRYRPHPTHFNLEEAVEVAKKINAKRTYLTHLSHEFDHDSLARDLPAGIEPAYDGMRIRVGISS